MSGRSEDNSSSSQEGAQLRAAEIRRRTTWRPSRPTGSCLQRRARSASRAVIEETRANWVKSYLWRCSRRSRCRRSCSGSPERSPDVRGRLLRRAGSMFGEYPHLVTREMVDRSGRSATTTWSAFPDAAYRSPFSAASRASPHPSSTGPTWAAERTCSTATTPRPRCRPMRPRRW